MYEKVLKIITVLVALLTIVVCVCVQYFPDMHERAVQAAELEQWLATREPEAETPKQVAVSLDVVEEEELGGQIKIQMPENIRMGDVRIENDYLTQTVFISFASDAEDYFSKYNISGSSDHIASLSYYNEKEKGVIALGLDKVYEIETNMQDENLYLDFISPHDIYDKVIVVDAGHGGKAPGAVKQQTIEKDVNLEIVLELKKILDASTENIGVYYTRVEDVNPTLQQRAALANKAEADLFISVHNNSSMSGNFNDQTGTHLLYSQSDTSEYSSEKFAQICLKNMTKILGSKSLGLMPADNIYIIRTSEVPVALIEVGYLTNRGDLEKLNSPEYRKKAAQGIYNSILEAFEKGF